MKLSYASKKTLEGRIFILSNGDKGRFVPDPQSVSVGFTPSSPYYWADWCDDKRAKVNYDNWDWLMFVEEFNAGTLNVIGRSEKF